MATQDIDSRTQTDGILDPAVLQSLRDLAGEDDPDLLRELIDIYLEDAPLRLSEMARGMQLGDWKLLERAAHTLKSASANIGALRLSGICKELEQSARAQDRTTCETLFDRSSQHFPEVQLALRGVRG